MILHSIGWFRARSGAAAVLALAWLGAVAGCAPAGSGVAAPYDLVIENGHVIDGTGSPWYAADVGIRGGRIEIGRAHV